MAVMMEYFEYNLSYHDHLWRILSLEAKKLHDIGITAVWLPPAFKGASGKNDVGYGVYDLYDLGEFDQKWSVPTKYGTKDEYLYAIASLHKLGIEVYPDIVFNHRMGADNVNLVEGYPVSGNDRYHRTGKTRELLVPTQFNYYHRHNAYSAFKWTADHFNGVDYDFNTHKKAIYLINDKNWAEGVSHEFGNYDYLMGSNVDVNHPDVKAELIRFGNWYKQLTNCDGFRLDALKHIDYHFFNEWIYAMRQNKNYFIVGEYWSGSVDELVEYLGNVYDGMSLFDVPLHYHFYEASKNPDHYDLRDLFKDTLVSTKPWNAVTFVDNHDTQPGQALSSFVHKWFKPFAYACILLRSDGYPCIFFGDYYGLQRGNYKGIEKDLNLLLMVKKDYADSFQHDYIDANQMGWTREKGCAVLFNIRENGYARMFVGKHFTNQCFFDIFSRSEVYIDGEGYGNFTSRRRKLAVYIHRRGK